METTLHLPPDTPFSRHNLPYGVFRPGAAAAPRVGVALGDHVIDLARLEATGLFEDFLPRGAAVFARPALNPFLALGRPAWDGVRGILQQRLGLDGPLRLDPVLAATVQPLSSVTLCLPVAVGDYTDFYSSREHATNVGAMFRGPDNALLPNWLHLPVAYHGRASSIVLSETPVRRPRGQSLPAGTSEPVEGPTRELDFELELGLLVGPGNTPGEPIPVAAAADHIFGFVLVNDWSARDIQRWEYRPLGPFLGKNFATSISPWVVPLAALEPFRVPGPPQDPAPLPYLQDRGDRAFDVQLEARLQTAAMAAAGLPPVAISRTNARWLYWSVSQMVAHHTVNGCALRPGDLLATGTISGPTPDSLGSLLELAWNGTRALTLPTGEARTFLEDGDRLTLTGWAGEGEHRIGFGAVSGTIVPAPEPGP
jgi:fumarylacetoacetase